MESWTVKKAECWRIDAFELWCWRRCLRVPWTARRSNQSILKEISPGISLEGIMLKLKLQYFGHLIRRVNSLEKTLMLGRIGGRRKRGQQRMRWLDGITDSMDVSLSELRDGQGGLACCDSWGRRVGHDWATELNWCQLYCWSCSQHQLSHCYLMYTLFSEPIVGKARVKRLEENVRSQRKCRCIYSVLAGIAAVVADIT